MVNSCHGWPTLSSLVDHFWEHDDYQQLHNMRILDVKLLDLDKDNKNALVRKVTIKDDGRRCTGYIWCFRVHTHWFYKCITLDDGRFWDTVVVPAINELQFLMKRESDKIDNGREICKWM